MRQIFASTGSTGHRQRMRLKVMSQGTNSLEDYELLEMLLFPAIPRRDTKPLAKALINAFGSLTNVLAASAEELKKHGANQAAADFLKLMPVITERLSFPKEDKRRADISNWESLLGYCDLTLVDLPGGQMRALFLDTKNQLLMDEVIEEDKRAYLPVHHEKAVSESHITNKMVTTLLRHALTYYAAALITVRVTPDNVTPEEQMEKDRGLVEALLEAAPLLSIEMHDHFVFKDGKFLSFQSELQRSLSGGYVS